MVAIYLIAVISILYGIGWVICAFKEPSSSIERYFRPPSALYFFPDVVSRLIMGAVFLFLIPYGSHFIVAMFTPK